MSQTQILTDPGDRPEPHPSQPAPRPIPYVIPFADTLPLSPPIAKPVIPAAPAPVAPPPLPMGSLRNRISDISTSLTFAPIAALFPVFAWAAWNWELNPSKMAILFLTLLITVWAAMVPSKMLEGFRHRGWSRILFALLGAGVGTVVYWFQGASVPELVSNTSPRLNGTESYWQGNLYLGHDTWRPWVGHVIFFSAFFFLMKWVPLVDRQREKRFSVEPMLAAGFWCLVLWFVGIWFEFPSKLVWVSAIATPLVLQLSAPWTPPAAAVRRPVRRVLR